MIVARSLKDVPADSKPTVVTIGVFDGVHKGHQMLIARVVESAHARGATPAVVTFNRHPLELLAPEKAPQLITTVPQRAEVLEGLGVELLVVLHFDDALRHLTPEDFVRRVLVDALGSVHVVVGSNFRFGFEHAGNVQTLHELGSAYGFTVEDFSLLGGKDAISSTLIRRQIADGDVESVATELGRPFRLEGHVERGAGRGKELGVPTANLSVPPRMVLPKIGVYAGRLTWKGERYPAVINVGLNPTFEDRTSPIVEVHVLDFDRDIYGEVVGVEFTHRLRDEKKFSSVEDLKAAMKEDIERGRALLLS